MLALFVRESNWIEGIRRDPTNDEVEAHRVFLALETVTVRDVERLVSVVQPDAVLRRLPNQNVRVGNHVAPRGGPDIEPRLMSILAAAGDPFQTHLAYETLHPFTDGNGRSGRALWLRTMKGDAPLGFLHHWYYQSLANSR